MINVTKILLDVEQCKGHTGLTPEGFAYLLELFKTEYDIYQKERHQKRYDKKRIYKKGGGNKGKLDTYEKKLFYILYYLKTYQTYETLGGAFDMKRPRAYERVESTLTPLIESLKKTVWFLHLHRQNWITSWENIQNGKMFLLMLQKEQVKEIQITKNKKKTIQVKRKDIL